MKSVCIYTARAAREANWQLYLHVCSLGEHNQLGSCRSLAGFPPTPPPPNPINTILIGKEKKGRKIE